MALLGHRRFELSSPYFVHNFGFYFLATYHDHFTYHLLHANDTPQKMYV